jgi:hypothetical protein
MQQSCVGLLYSAVTGVGVWAASEFKLSDLLVIFLAGWTLRSSYRIERITASNTAVAANQATVAIEQEKLLLFRAFQSPLFRCYQLSAYINSKTIAIATFHEMYEKSINSHLPTGTGAVKGPAPISRPLTAKEEELKQTIENSELALLDLKQEFGFTLFLLVALKVGALGVLNDPLMRLKNLADKIATDHPPLADITAVLNEIIQLLQKLMQISYKNLQQVVEQVSAVQREAAESPATPPRQSGGAR